MKHRPPFLGIAALCALCVTTAAIAQIAPGDTGAGIQRGMHSVNNSGEVGTVTLFARAGGAKTLVVIELAGEPNGRHQPASLHRGKACDDVTPEPAYPLSAWTNSFPADSSTHRRRRIVRGHTAVSLAPANKNTLRHFAA